MRFVDLRQWAAIGRRAGPISLLLLPFVILVPEVGPSVGLIAGFAALAWTWNSTGAATELPWTEIAIAGAVATAIGPPWYRGTAYHYGAIAVSLVGLLLIVRSDGSRPTRRLHFALGTSLIGLVWAMTHDPGGYLDGILMHQAAADALAVGQSPWALSPPGEY